MADYVDNDDASSIGSDANTADPANNPDDLQMKAEADDRIAAQDCNETPHQDLAEGNPSFTLLIFPLPLPLSCPRHNLLHYQTKPPTDYQHTATPDQSIQRNFLLSVRICLL